MPGSRPVARGSGAAPVSPVLPPRSTPGLSPLGGVLDGSTATVELLRASACPPPPPRAATALSVPTADGRPCYDRTGVRDTSPRWCGEDFGTCSYEFGVEANAGLGVVVPGEEPEPG